jgi:putative nucleotidyltransferase with HDIG domain
MRPKRTSVDAATERHLDEGRKRRSLNFDARERLSNGVFGGGFVVAAVLIALLAEPARSFSAPLAIAFFLTYAAVARVPFWSGSGFVVPTHLVFVPMLLLLPTPLVPLLVAAGLVVATAIDAARREVAPVRCLVAVSDAWYAVGPALVLIALDAQLPAWSNVPAYALALAAQLILDGAMNTVRVALSFGVPPREFIRELPIAARVDALLAPIGLLAAIAAADVPAAALLVWPLVVLIAIFSREREARIAQTLELGRAYRGTALLLRDLLEEDDEYTGHHTEDVVALAVRVADEMGLDEDEKRATELGALLHDIGKIAVPDEIINKAGPLNDEEWAIMRTHTVEGQRMLDSVGGLLSSVGVVVRASHERWDGGGYPDGLVGEQIPRAARIVAACDAFNAMTTDRSYRRALPLDVAIAELRTNAGTQFDPAVAEALIAVVEREHGESDPGWQLTVAPPPAALPAPAPVADAIGAE